MGIRDDRYTAIKAVEGEVPVLIKVLQDQEASKSVHVMAAWALAKIGKDAVPALIQALQDQDSQVHANAVLALGEIGTLEALKAVKEYESQQ